jgi:ABC-2 type transport system permease protein
MIGIVLFAAIVSLLGYALGLLVRSTPAAVSILILWPLLVENIVAAILIQAGVEHASKWMPYSAGITLGFIEAGQNADTLGRVAGGLYFLGVTSALVVAGAVLTQRRDA